jgi:hypothetical protein
MVRPGQVKPDLTYMNATLNPCHSRNPGSERKTWKNPSRAREIGTRDSDAGSIGTKQVPREPGCDTSSQPASEAGINLDDCRKYGAGRSLDGKKKQHGKTHTKHVKDQGRATSENGVYATVPRFPT